MKLNSIRQTSVLVLFIALILSFTANCGRAQAVDWDRIKWDPGITIPTADGMGVYEIINEPVQRDDFKRLAEKIMRELLGRPDFKLRDEHIGYDDGSIVWVSMENPSSFIMQDITNGDLTRFNSTMQFTVSGTIDLPTKDEAANIAISFLRDVGMLPDDFDSRGRLVQSGGVSTQTISASGPGVSTQMSITLHWGRMIDDIPVEGPGSRIVVEIGHEGEIVNFHTKWNPIREKPFTETEVSEEKGIVVPLAPYPFFVPEDIKTLSSRALLEEWATADLIEVKDVQLVYYDRSGDYIQPVYAVQAVIHTGEFEMDYLYHQAALIWPPEPIYLPSLATFPREPDSEGGMDSLTDAD